MENTEAWVRGEFKKMKQSRDIRMSQAKTTNVTVLAGCLTLGTFLTLPYAHLIKASSDPVLELISIEQSDWQLPPQLPVPEAEVAEEETTILPKPDLVTVREEIVPLKSVLDFDLGVLDVGGDFDVSFSVNPSLGGGVSVFEISDVDSMPQPLVQLRPHYPAHARMRQIEGNVRVIFVVNAKGRTENIRILSSSSDGTFDRAAERAVERWRFSPGMLDDKPVAVQVMQNIRFELE